jgi:hypothetical protein
MDTGFARYVLISVFTNTNQKPMQRCVLTLLYEISGLQAQEIHLCGEETAVPLVQKICESTGETVQVHRYNRLTKLTCEKRGLSSSFSNIKPGDCFVTFSRKNIFLIRNRIESYTKLKCAVIYGSLPPGGSNYMIYLSDII